MLHLKDNINIKKGDKYIALSNLSIYDTWKNIKKSYKNNTELALDPILHQIFKIILSISSKKRETLTTGNPPMHIY